jgi:hypothetical protein
MNSIFQKTIVVLIAVLSLTACTPTVTPISVTTAPAERVPLTLPPVDVLYLRPVEWIIITKDNAEEVFARLESQGRTAALFALTDSGYENLSLNISDIRKLAQQQRAIIVSYENYINNSGGQAAQ